MKVMFNPQISNTNFKASYQNIIESELHELNKPIIKKILKRFPNGINNYPAQTILESMGKKCRTDRDGMLIISDYSADKDFIKFSELGIDENRLFKYIRKIEGSADLLDSKATDFGNLESIGGDLWLNSIKKLGKLKSVEGDVYLMDYNFKPEDLKSVQVKGKIIDCP